MYARFDQPVHMYRGETMAGLVADESRHDPDRGFAGGYYLETISLGPAFLAAFVEPGAWGPHFTAILDAYDNTAGLWIVGEDMPRETNRVTLDRTVTDAHRTPPHPSTHNLGTTRMSERPEDGVVDAFGRTHDVANLFVSDSSVFTTGAAANPVLTIVALATRQADFILDELKRGNL